ncbi:uncharacterized protein LOC143279707 isoform X2 [Babylonia areolata]|uniref:uncharacterized protein LOC143279707 isoform X2 n=1 Tax=Babylonia areolata TaxID=304850 RepID=UPI003FD1F3BE
MTSEAGLSIKERLALLQASNAKNPQLAGPMKTPGHVPPKPGPAPAANTDKPNGQAAPFVALKPLAKPGPGVPGKPGAGGAAITPPVPPTKPTSPAGVGGTHAVGSKPNGDSHNAGPLVPKKPGGFSPASSGHVDTTSVTMRDKSDTGGNTPRPPSIQERMAALKEKAAEGAAAQPKPTTAAKPGDSGPKSPDAAPHQLKKVAFFPPAAGAAGLPANSLAVKPSDLAKSIQEAANRVLGRKASDTFLRHSDGKRFHKVSVASVLSKDPAPAKPAGINGVDLTSFLHAYAAAKESKLKVDAAKSETPEAEDGEMEELYVEAESQAVQVRVRGKGSIKRAMSVRVSEIPEFTEEEEEHELYIDSVSAETPAASKPAEPEEEYDDCTSAAAAVQSPAATIEEEEPDEIYEPLDELEDEVNEKEKEKEKERQKEKEKEAKAVKKKKDKAKEEVNKKEEKERKKREEEIKKQRSKFGLKETDEKVGEGVVKNNASAGVFSKDLTVSKGEIVTILRMDNNPAGKWLVQNEQGKLGFVNSNNVEVATPAIRQENVDEKAEQMMTGAPLLADSTADDGDPEELYEALPDEGEMDDIYEEL